MYKFNSKYRNVVSYIWTGTEFSAHVPSLTKFGQCWRQMCVDSKHVLKNATYKGTQDIGVKRIVDSPHLRTWDSWEAYGKKWWVQDLPPEDDDKAIQMLLRDLCQHEILCSYSNLLEDPESVRGVANYYRKYLTRRMSLACYTEVNSQRELVAVHVLSFLRKGEDPLGEVPGENFKNVYGALSYAESKVNKFEYLGLDEILCGMGLVVAEDYRGAKLGVKLLLAREQLCRYLGNKGSVGIFTSMVSQRVANRAGYTTLASVNMKELADHGLNYPRDETKEIKVMAKKYNLQ